MPTPTCPLPSNINPLSPNGFSFSITKLPEVSFFSQQVSIPQISLGSIDQGTPFVMVPIPGEIMTFGELDLQFIIDEDMANYKALFAWIQGLGFPEDNKQYTDMLARDTVNQTELSKNYSDAILGILSSSNNPTTAIRFVDVFPVSLSSLTFNSTSQDVQYLIGSASFKYSYYNFI